MYIVKDLFNKVISRVRVHIQNNIVNYPQESTDVGIRFHSCLEGNNLTQLITEPTRLTSQHASILDHVITNCPAFFTNMGALFLPSNCDHSVVFAEMNIWTFKCHS